MNIMLLIFLSYLLSTVVYWTWMLVRMPSMKFDSWTQRIGFSAIVLKAAALWPVSVAVKLWDRIKRQN